MTYFLIRFGILPSRVVVQCLDLLDFARFMNEAKAAKDLELQFRQLLNSLESRLIKFYPSDSRFVSSGKYNRFIVTGRNRKVSVSDKKTI